MKNPTRVKRIQTMYTKPSKTDQSQKKECDVNSIMRKFRKTGQITHLSQRQGVYADVSQIPDLMGAMEQISFVQSAFDALPSELRFKLQNKPENLVDYLNDPKNDEEAIKYGLKTRKAGQQPVAGSKQAEGAQAPKGKKTKTPPAANDDELNDDE